MSFLQAHFPSLHARQGKSTTLKMLTGDVSPSGGTAFLGDLDMLKRAQDVRSLMGYCPQSDALDELLTAEEVCVSCLCMYFLETY